MCSESFLEAYKLDKKEKKWYKVINAYKEGFLLYVELLYNNHLVTLQLLDATGPHHRSCACTDIFWAT